jgi:N-ethylmaleimide reductase
MAMSGQKKLFTPVSLGAFTLKHRVMLPPLSRLRAQWPSAVPTDIMREYYTQRASDGGLIVAEAAAVLPAGRAYHTAPGIWSDDQVRGWKRVTDEVQAKGGVMFVQLTHAGRATSSAIGDVLPVSASVDPSFWSNENIVVSTPNGFALPSPHRALEVSDIQDIVEHYRAAALNAKRAGFDGVEILAGQGHLIEQFLHDSTNKRTDSYGGSIENRTRFLCEILKAVTEVLGSDRVGVRISLSSVFNGMGDSNPQALYRDLVARLNVFDLAYLHIIEPRISGADTVAEAQGPVASLELGKLFQGTVIAAGGFTPESAEAAVTAGVANLIAFGRHFTSNPDLPFRIEHDLPFTPYDRSTFYAFDAKGYTDFATYEAPRAAKAA